MKTKSIILAALLSVFAVSTFAAPHPKAKHHKHHAKHHVVHHKAPR